MSTNQEHERGLTRVFIYAIGTIDGPVKFGITTNLASRLRSLQNGSSTRLELIWAYTCEDREAALRMEKNIHAVCVPRLEGEWFDIDAEQAFDYLHLELESLFDNSLKCGHAGKPLCFQKDEA